MSSSSLRSARLGAFGVDVAIILGLATLCGPLGWAASVIYWLVRDGCFTGQSIGKRLMGLKVVAGKERRPCRFGTSMVRNVLWVIPVVNVLTFATALYSLFNDPTGRHWGDRLADTRVVKA